MKRFILPLVLIMLSAAGVFAQKAPSVYMLPVGDKVVIVLGDTPRNVSSFNVFRAEGKSRDYKLMTKDPVSPVKDPYKAVELMGEDFNWIARKMGSMDPDFVYNRLMVDRNTAMALCLISHGLRLAMGRTFVDDEAVKGRSYRYRVVLLDVLGKEINRVEKNVTVKQVVPPQKPSGIETSAGDSRIIIKWKYPPYRGGDKDIVTGFVLNRREGTGDFIRITGAPVLRVEGRLSYVDEGVKNGKSYIYAVEAVNMVGVKSEKLYSESVRPVDNSPPLVPEGLKALDKEEGVLLLWRISPEADADHYNVYRGESLKGDFEKVNDNPVPVGSPRFLDMSAVRGIVHYYRVTAVDNSGNESDKSGPASIIPKDTEPPAAVTGLSADVDADKRFVDLSWRPKEASDLSGFFIYRGESKERMMRIVKDPVNPKDTTFTDKGYKGRGLHPGRNMFYAVTGVDTSGNESERVYVDVIIPDNVPPPPPFSLSAKPEDTGTVLLIWQPCLSRDLAKHYIYRSKSGDFVKMAELDKEVYQWEDSSVERGKEYFYKVTEVDSSGNESKPSREVRVIPTDVNAPVPLSGLEAEVEKRGIRLIWEPSAEEDLKGYNVYSLPPGKESWKLTAELLDTAEYFHRWAKSGTSYSVTAVDTSGNESRKSVFVTAGETEKSGAEQ